MDQSEAYAIFAKVSELASISAAARALGMPKASVSRAVSRLEAAYGVSLIDRTSNRVKLTEIGLTFRARCLRVLEEIDEAKAEIAAYRGHPCGTLRVGCSSDLRRDLLASYLPDFLERYPEIDLRVTVAERLIPEPNGLDLVVHAGWLSDSRLVARKITAIHTLLVASRQYVEKRGLPTSVEDLEGHSFVGNFYLDRAASEPGQLPANVPVLEVTRDGQRHVLPIWPRFASTDHSLMLDFVRRGIAIAPIAAVRIAEELQAGELVRVLPGYRIYNPPTLYAVYTERAALAPKVTAFIDFLAERAADQADTIQGLSRPGAVAPEGRFRGSARR